MEDSHDDKMARRIAEKRPYATEPDKEFMANLGGRITELQEQGDEEAIDVLIEERGRRLHGQ